MPKGTVGDHSRKQDIQSRQPTLDAVVHPGSLDMRVARVAPLGKTPSPTPARNQAHPGGTFWNQALLMVKPRLSLVSGERGSGWGRELGDQGPSR